MKRGVALAVVGWVVMVLASTGLALPPFAADTGNSCKSCHSNVVTGKIAVSGHDKLWDLGTQLDGKTRGPLKTFAVEPGETVSLSADVLDGSDPYALQLKRLEKHGQLNDTANLLTDWEADPGWNKQEVTNPPYFTTDIITDGSAGTFTFDLGVGAATPPDFYDLEFAIAGHDGGDLWYQDEHFYVEVMPEPATVLLLGLGVLWLRRGRTL